MSITGQVGHIALARQSAFGVPNTTQSQYVGVKITGDSLVASNNPLVAEGEIGVGRDVSDAVPGGFSAAGAINGNLRSRAASIFLEGVLGQKVLADASVGGGSGDSFHPINTLPAFTIEKKVGPASPQLLILRYQDAEVNTLNITAPAGALATYSAGLITAGESRQAVQTATPVFPSSSDDLLVFHGGRIMNGPNGGVVARDETFQSVELVINNNIAADEYTVRPSRFLRSLTEGIRSVEINMTLVFENPDKYSRYTYGLSGGTESVLPNAPGYSFYMGALKVFLGNWQFTNDAQDITTTGPAGAPASPQAMQYNIPKLAFTGFPVALASGRIVVTTTARALKDPNQSEILTAFCLPTAAGLNY